MSTISSTSSYTSAAQSMSGMHRRRPDPSQMVDDLFSKLDTKNQGYLEKSDLESALSSSSTSGSSASVDEIFSSLDSDNDGKITKDEMSSGLKKLTEELDSQRNADRMAQAMGGMPPPPPPPENDAGFTEDELATQLGEATANGDTERAELLNTVLSNFSAADTDGDGKVTFQEAMAYKQSQESRSEAAVTSTTDASATDNVGARVLRQMMQLLAAYGSSTTASSTLSTSA